MGRFVTCLRPPLPGTAALVAIPAVGVQHRRASRAGFWTFCLYLCQLVPGPLPQHSFLRGIIKAYSVARWWGGPATTTLVAAMGAWRNVRLRNQRNVTCVSPASSTKGVWQWWGTVQSDWVCLCGGAGAFAAQFCRGWRLRS